MTTSSSSVSSSIQGITSIVDVDVDVNADEDGRSFADESTVVVRNITPRSSMMNASTSNSNNYKECASGNHDHMTGEEKEIARSLQERKVTESMRRALVMNQRDAGVTQDSRLDYMSVGNYPLSVATGDAVKSHRLPSVAENGEGLDQGTGGSDDEKGEVGAGNMSGENKLDGLLNFPIPIFEHKLTSRRRVCNRWLFGGISLAVVGVIVGILFALDVFGSSSDDQSLYRYNEEDYIAIFEAVSERVLLETPKSPQQRALDWIINTDTYGLVPNEDGNNGALLQRYTMALFYYTMSGSSWLLSTNWLSGSDICRWYGLSCFPDGTVSEMIIGMYNICCFIELIIIDRV